MKELLKDEYITITSTEHNFDIIAIIENDSEEVITFETSGEELFGIEPKKYIGLIADNESRRILKLLKTKKYYRYAFKDGITYEIHENASRKIWIN